LEEGRILMSALGKLLIVLGGFLVLAGLLTLVLGRTNFPLGRLPGDFVYRGKNTSFYFPLATSILLSFVLSFVLYLINRWRR
jgi:formate hydrogenlyase subunit 3/multisubunit Na+/H+ antiporter MnhD subunit